MAALRKGLSNIRTISGRVHQTFTPYRAYMQISCLEMEKSRRLEERKNAATRIAEIDARLTDIEAEKSMLEEALNLEGAVRRPVAKRDPSIPRGERRKPGLKLQY
ncbi:MAG: hypothetical protein PHT19_08740 [Methylococcus sp.]|nr:hypothetical protein [Methylococcus sp.]